MESRYNNSFVSEHKGSLNTSEKGAKPPVEEKISNTTAKASPRKSRRASQKRVVTVPIPDLDGNRVRGEGAPPSDSWAWRKYGQKPIKGSPHPRGYYRCSSSKGCPARKQVERSRMDPTMLMVTYACEHNHPWPTSRTQQHHKQQHQQETTPTANTADAVITAISTLPVTSSTTTLATAEGSVGTPKVQSEEPTVFENQAEIEPDEKFADLGEEPMIISDDFCWFSDMVSSSSATVLESPFCTQNTTGGDVDVAILFPMREEDELLYADLGELPECSLVFRRSGVFKQDEESNRCSLRAAPLCRSSG